MLGGGETGGAVQAVGALTGAIPTPPGFGVFAWRMDMVRNLYSAWTIGVSAGAGSLTFWCLRARAAIEPERLQPRLGFVGSAGLPGPNERGVSAMVERPFSVSE